MVNFFKKIIVFFLLFFLCSCGGGGGGTSSSSGTTGGTTGTGGSTGGVTATASDNVSKVEVSGFSVEDSCNVTFKAYSYDKDNNAIKDAELVLTVTQGSKTYSKTETTGSNGLATFSVDICTDLTTSSVSTSAAEDTISFEIKPKSTVSTASKTLSLKADSNGKIDTTDLINGITVSIDNITETSIKFKIQSSNKLKDKQVYFVVNDQKKLLDDKTDDNGTIYYTYYPGSANGDVIFTAEPFFKLKSFTSNSVTVPVASGKVEVKKIPETLQLLTSKLSVSANDNDSTVITIYSTNQFGAVDGAEFEVSTDYGSVSANSVTLKNGFGEFTFKSSYYPNVKEAVVTVKDKNSDLKDSIKISLIGLTLTVSSNKQFIKANGSDSADIDISVTDASNNPVIKKAVEITTDNTNITLKKGSTNIDFTNNKATVDTDESGKINLNISSSSAGTVTLKITADTEESTLTFNFSGEEFLFKKDNATVENNLKLQVNKSHVFQFSWKDENGTGINDKVTLYTNLGSLSSYNGTTCGDNKSSVDLNVVNGEAYFCYASSVVGDTVIQAVNETDNKSTSLEATVISDLPPAKIILQTSDSILPYSTETVKNTATITALVLDKNNYPVANKKILFSLGTNTSTGEKVFPIYAVTDSTGRATTTFTSGGGVSGLNGIVVKAKYKDNESVEGEVTLTVSNKAVSIAIGKGIVIEDSNNVTNYKKPFTVLVVDSNGSPVANQKINLSIYLTKYTTSDNITHPNEDTNHNNELDTGEDLNGNNKLDPGENVATIPSEVTTDDSGFSVFYVEYPKCYAYWTDVKIIATTEVAGSEYGKGVEFKLTYAEKDKDNMPCKPSPFDNITSPQ